MGRWYLSFDCATKTFAFSLSWVDLDAYAAARDSLRRRAAAAEVALGRAAGFGAAEVAALAAAVARLSAETAAFVRIADGAVADLAPGRADKDVSTIERIRAVKAYVGGRVLPALDATCGLGAPLRVVVEFQMGQNPSARAVSDALVTIFAERDVVLVGPSLKNTISVAPGGEYGAFVEKYTSIYGANKAHTRFNFLAVEAAFGTGIGEIRPAAMRGHIADSFMQVLGHLVNGKTDETAF